MPQVPKLSVPWDTVDQSMIATAKQWERRNFVLDSHKAHLEFLSKRKLSVSRFSNALTNEANDQKLNAICVMPNSLRFAA